MEGKAEAPQVGGTSEESDGFVTEVGHDPVMAVAAEMMQPFARRKRAVIRAKGDAIPSAVAVANIVIDGMQNSNARAHDITVDSDAPPGIGRMTSTIRIVLVCD